MLLVTFHGGSGSSSINNVHVYDTSDGKHLTKDALGAPTQGKLSELRAMVLANGLLYVANGAKSQSTVLAYNTGTSFTCAATLIGPSLSNKGHFESAIAHPFGIVFNGTSCFISNQDTNVVAQVTVSNNGLTGSLVQGPSDYLKGLFATGTFLDGTCVASQVGILNDVDVITTVVDHVHGGLGASLDKGSVKNSVRDVAIANGILLVCDEPENVVNLYSLTDGSYLGSSNALADGPTHLAINNGGLMSAPDRRCTGDSCRHPHHPPRSPCRRSHRRPLLRESKSVESLPTAHRQFTFRISKASAATTRVARSTATV